MENVAGTRFTILSVYSNECGKALLQLQTSIRRATPKVFLCHRYITSADGVTPTFRDKTLGVTSRGFWCNGMDVKI